MKSNRLTSFAVLLVVLIVLTALYVALNRTRGTSSLDSRYTGSRASGPRPGDTLLVATEPRSRPGLSTSGSVARTQLLTHFSGRYSEWVTRWNRMGSGSTWALRELVHDAKFLELCALLDDRESGLSSDSLVQMSKEAESHLRYLLLAVLARRGDIEKSGVIPTDWPKTQPDDSVLKALCCWGIAASRNSERTSQLIEYLKDSYSKGGGSNELFEYTLGLAGKQGLAGLVSIAESQLHKLSIKDAGGQFSLVGLCDSPEAIGDLRSLAETHPSAWIRLMALKSLVLTGPENIDILKSRIATETDGQALSELSEIIARFAFVGRTKALDAETKAALAEFVSKHPQAPQAIQLRALATLDPKRFLDSVEAILKGQNIKSKDDYDVQRAIIGYLPHFDDPRAQSLLLEVAANTNLGQRPEIVRSLSEVFGINDKAVIESLLGIVAGDGGEMDSALLGNAAKALSQVSTEWKDIANSELVRVYHGSWSAMAKIAVLQNAPAMGDQGIALLREAAKDQDAVIKSTAYLALAKSAAFDREPELRREIASFVTGVTAQPAREQRQIAHILTENYIELFQILSASKGALSNDQEFLRRMANSPFLPVSWPESRRRTSYEASVQEAARAGLDCLRWAN